MDFRSRTSCSSRAPPPRREPAALFLQRLRVAIAPVDRSVEPGTSRIRHAEFFNQASGPPYRFGPISAVEHEFLPASYGAQLDVAVRR